MKDISLSPRRQQGLTLISWIVVASIAGTILVCGMRLVPVYLDFFSVKKSFESLYDENNPIQKVPSAKDVRKAMDNKLRMNQVKSF